ncbi:MAG: galactose-1-phosphate uridylyltransferase [Cyanobacteriota bacterium]|nr:galactose-1-phosphate uridylyltransferase [Cyanobacteriota bacterium]
MSSGHIRLNKATREWVIYAPSRRKRPQDFQKTRSQPEVVHPKDPQCPFCRSDEQWEEPIILEMPNSNRTGWQTRVVPNKFPALVPHEQPERKTDGIYLAMPGYGQHEVVIESPEHHLDLATMPLEAVEILMETYHKRYIDLMATHENMMAIIFRNHGVKAGASLKHPHSQIIVTGMVPQHIRWQEQEAQRHYDEWARCLYCDILQFEMQDRQREIAENASFFAFVPYAAEVPFEMWIMPKEHQADFGSISDREKTDLALILQELLRRLYVKLNDPDYNYVIDTAARYKAEEPQVHWYLRIQPRLTTLAGFEIGSGISINPSLPELDAAFLRA